MDSPLDSFPSEDPSPASSRPPALRARVRRLYARYGITRARLAPLVIRTRETLSRLRVSVVARAHATAGALGRGARALTRESRALTVTTGAHAAVIGRAIDTHAAAAARALGAHARSVARALARGIAGWRARDGWERWPRRRTDAGLALAGATAANPGRPHAPAAGTRSDLWVIAIAALTSAGVSLLTVWLWSPDLTAVADQAAAIAEVPDVSALATPVPPQESPGTPSAVAVATGASATDRTDAARAPAPAPSRLVVITQPAGARVTVDGVGWGVSPVTIRYLPPGARRVRVTKAGYRGEERIVRLDEAVAPTVRISLRRVTEQRARASDPSADHE